MMRWARSLFDFPLIHIFFLIVAVLYAFGGAIHIANMLSLSGYPWSAAPLSWKILDAVFLLLNATVVVTVLLKSGWAVSAFLLAAGIQVVLYAFFPDQFGTTPDHARAIRHLLMLNAVLIGAFFGLVAIRRFV
jgi:hypothetical protein